METPNPWSKPLISVHQRNQADITWKPPPIIEEYSIERRTKDTPWVEIGRVPAHRHKVSVPNLNEETEYEFRVVAVGRAGYYQPSQSTGLQRLEKPTGVTADDIFYKIRSKKPLIIGTPGHPHVQKAMDILGKLDKKAEIIDLETAANDRENIERTLLEFTCRSEFPLVFVKGDCVGGVSDLEKINESGILQEWLRDHEYDLAIIGGGPGGMAAAMEAASYKKKVVLVDYVVPTALGTTWGIGGTSPNVGCIPKKLLHHTALLGQSLKDARDYGWRFDEKVSHNWDSIKYSIQSHVSTTAGKNKQALRKYNITYFNNYAKFSGSHMLALMDEKGDKAVKSISADRFILACGLRPKIGDVPGAANCITSDDLFKLAYPPGKTLILGGSYIALECAGFLHGLGFQVAIMSRTNLLSGCDKDMVERISKYLIDFGVRVFVETFPTKIEKIEDGKPGKLKVMARRIRSTEEIMSEYNTVLVVTGRQAMTDNMSLDLPGVRRNEGSKKIECLRNDQSVSTPYVYAIGDIVEGAIERTNVAIKAGRLLARRLFFDSTKLCDYTHIPKTVFMGLEYGYVGLTEEEASEKFGVEGFEVFFVQFNPLELSVPYRKGYELKMPRRKEFEHCYAKLICNKLDDLRVVGFHIFGPNAAEITQGFTLALKLNAKKADFDNMIGIHPTIAELFTTMQVSKAACKTANAVCVPPQ